MPIYPRSTQAKALYILPALGFTNQIFPPLSAQIFCYNELKVLSIAESKLRIQKFKVQIVCNVVLERSKFELTVYSIQGLICFSYLQNY